MFQDDRMIPVLSAAVLMVVVGTVLQRVDGIDRSLGGTPAPAIALRDDAVAAPASALLRIDVFANDEGVTDEMRQRLSVVTAPACGRLFVRDGILEYLADPGCEGRQTIRYSFGGATSDQVATVTARIRASADPRKPVVARPDAPSPVVASNDPAPGPMLASATRSPGVPVSTTVDTGDAAPATSAGTVPAVGPAVSGAPPVLIAATPAAGDPTLSPTAPTPILAAPAGTAPLATVAPAATDAAFEGRLAALQGAAPAAMLSAPAAMPEAVGMALSEASTHAASASGSAAPGDAARKLAALPDYAVPAGAGVPVIVVPAISDEPPQAVMTVVALDAPPATLTDAEPAIESGIAAAPTTAPVQAGAALPGRSLHRAVPGGTPAAKAPWPEAPRLALPGGADAGMAFAAAAPADADPRPVRNPDAAGPAFLLAIIGNVGTGVAHASDVSDADPVAALIGLAAGTGAPEAGIRVAGLAPAHLAPTVAAPGPALNALPGDRLVLSTPGTAWIGRGSLAAGADDGVRIAALDPAAALPGPGDARAVTAPASPVVPVSRAVPAEPCLAPPDMTLEVHSAAETIVSVTARCHAATVAELSYSGLRLAVPLDGNGRGAVRVQGFEPNTPALLTFGDGTAVDLELPFRGVDRISRVALAWEAPVELELNALEFGAAPGTSGHVRPGLARSFAEVRRSGGGYLTVWHPVGDVGQSLQIYSWYHRSGESAGVVKLLLDFVSRDRDRLATTCGDGPAAAPQFIVLRSNTGRPERPVIRQLAPVDCGRVAAPGRDNRLISGAVDDLVIMSR